VCQLSYASGRKSFRCNLYRQIALIRLRYFAPQLLLAACAGGPMTVTVQFISEDVGHCNSEDYIPASYPTLTSNPIKYIIAFKQ
jgi:hypothetical protein